MTVSTAISRILAQPHSLGEIDRANDALAELFTDDCIDSSQIEAAARLRRRGCPPMLAVRLACPMVDELLDVAS